MKKTRKPQKDEFWMYIKSEYPEDFWFFIRKVHERLELLFRHKVPNHFDVDETDEKLLREMYEWYSQSELFQPQDGLTEEEVQRFTDKVSAE